MKKRLTAQEISDERRNDIYQSMKRLEQEKGYTFGELIARTAFNPKESTLLRQGALEIIWDCLPEDKRLEVVRDIQLAVTRHQEGNA